MYEYNLKGWFSAAILGVVLSLTAFVVGVSAAPKQHTTTIPYFQGHSDLMIRATVGGVKGWYVLDTGSAFTIVDVQEFLKGNPQPQIDGESGAIGFDGKSVKVLYTPADVKIGDETRAEEVMLAPIDDTDGAIGLIGESTLNQYDLVVINYKKQTITFRNRK